MPAAWHARTAAINYIAADDPDAALGQLDEIVSQTSLLATNPEMGSLTDKPGARRLVIVRTRFVIGYRIRPRAKRIEIFQFTHSSRNWH